MNDLTQEELMPLIKWLQAEYIDCTAEADYCSGLLSSPYWRGKADAFNKVLKYLERMGVHE